MRKINIAVLYGGLSPEHEISIITGVQVLNTLNARKYNSYPIYLTKNGDWILGDNNFRDIALYKDLNLIYKNGTKINQSLDRVTKTLFVIPAKGILGTPKRLKIDVVFPAFHGRYGEDGAIQGLLELVNLAYIGCGVQASAIGMDKEISKKIARSLRIPVLPSNWCTKNEWLKSRRSVIKKVIGGLEFPVFVKPAHLGSSIGIAETRNNYQLEDALEVAFFYDTKIMIEQAFIGAREINISLLGNNPYEFSSCEQPISSGDFLSFAAKYQKTEGPSKGMASARRIIPAKIKKETEQKIRDYASSFFAEIGGQGIARVDFLVSEDEHQIYFNEVNTMPGSVAFYLWKERGISFTKLLDRLIKLAFDARGEKDTLVTTFKSNVLEGYKRGDTLKKV